MKIHQEEYPQGNHKETCHAYIAFLVVVKLRQQGHDGLEPYPPSIYVLMDTHNRTSIIVGQFPATTQWHTGTSTKGPRNTMIPILHELLGMFSFLLS
jgi:hypothetical protein